MERSPDLDVTGIQLHDEAPTVLLQGHEPDLQQQEDLHMITDVVDTTLVDAVADEDRANLNMFHDTIDRAADAVVISNGEAEQQEHAAPDVLEGSAEAFEIDTAADDPAILNVHDAPDRSPTDHAASALNDRTE